ncbi:cupin domain-containing protein [Billgrantia sp. Q4P2]|uniref:cupin domain-containing protein n=1 Tax=Billgrantia sp. Q4P2 TaxID=3463857 RepID=UPI004057C72A
MKTIITPIALTVGLVAAIPIGAFAQDDALPAGFETEAVLKTTETRDGDAIAWPDGAPEIVSVIGTIEPGGRTPLHQHPVPAYVYVLEGEVELRTEGGDPYTYRTGEAYIEALNRDHQLFNVTDSEARVLVVFAAAQGQPTTVASE